MRDFSLNYALPLTAVAGKVRIKERNTFSDYGLPIAPTKMRISIKHYIEWQIGYDEVVVNDVLDETVKRMLAIIERYESC